MRFLSTIRRRATRGVLGIALLAAVPPAARSGDRPEVPLPPPTLAETGLYADFAARVVRPEALPFAPQYPLWTDGAHKRRWVSLPPGSAIDGSDPDQWRFPVGTRFWKEFAFERPIETRYLERLADGSWLFATYLWSADGATATLAPPRGVRRATESAPGIPYDVPGVGDCRACHGGHPATVLGFSALQLSSDRDPLAPHGEAVGSDGLDLRRLVETGRLRGLPPALAATPPRIEARSPRERAALGYLHANCSGCHNARGPLADDLGFSFAVAAGGHAELFDTVVERPARYRPQGAAESRILAPGDPEASLLLRRVASRQPLLQMPPLGSRRVDEEAAALLEAWIEELASPAARQTAQLTAAPGAALSEEKP